jgi:hypothetical protein
MVEVGKLFLEFKLWYYLNVKEFLHRETKSPEERLQELKKIVVERYSDQRFLDGLHPFYSKVKEIYGEDRVQNTRLFHVLFDKGEIGSYLDLPNKEFENFIRGK